MTLEYKCYHMSDRGTKRKGLSVSASLAQSVEHCANNARVNGSSPLGSTFFPYDNIISIHSLAFLRVLEVKRCPHQVDSTACEASKRLRMRSCAGATKLHACSCSPAMALNVNRLDSRILILRSQALMAETGTLA